MPNARISRDHQQRRPERPAHRAGGERGQRRAVAGDVVRGEPVRDRRRHREMDERHQRENFRGGIVVRDLFRRPEVAQHQHVGVGQQHIEGPDREDRARRPDPGADIVAPRPGRHFPGEAAVEQDELDERRRPGGECERRHRGGRVGGDAGACARRHRRDQHERAQHERRQQRDIDGVVRARQSVEHVAHRVERQRDAGEIERHDGAGVERLLERSARRARRRPRPWSRPQRRSSGCRAGSRAGRRDRCAGCIPGWCAAR